jgi:hypothetical protein
MQSIAPENGTATEPLTPYELTAADRCDSCGAQAYIRVELESGGELYFCSHHGKKFHDKLAATAKTWHDESARLLES